MSMCRMITVFVIFTIIYTMSIVDVHDNTNNRWLDLQQSLSLPYDIAFKYIEISIGSMLLLLSFLKAYL
jgi:hypothetical protein